jgi:flagellin
MIEEIDRIVADTDYQGTPLLDGTFTAQIFQVGSGDDPLADQLSISITGLSATTLGVGTTDVTTATNAVLAITALDGALDTLAGVLGGVGASMNRLDFTYSNLQVQIENFSASESVIRDVDMASEMTTYTKNQILLQAGTAMLAQANTSSQVVLSLFQ